MKHIIYVGKHFDNWIGKKSILKTTERPTVRDWKLQEKCRSLTKFKKATYWESLDDVNEKATFQQLHMEITGNM